MIKTTLMALTLAAVPVLAFAATPPANLTPSTDAAVTYGVHMVGKPGGTMSVAWKADTGRVRVESMMFPGWLLLQPRDNKASMVVDAQRAVVQMPPDVAQRGAPRVPPDATLTEAGTDTVAGLPCTLWNFTSASEGTGTLCVTDGRLMLRTVARVRGGEEIRIEAETVSTAPQDAARFVLPADYTSVAPTTAPAPAPAR
jgi:hypothetical protein